MKTKLALSAVAAAIAVFSQGAFAQASAPRQPRRRQGRAPRPRPASAPAGEAPTSRRRRPTSDKTRDERKATTKADQGHGNLKAAGEASRHEGRQGHEEHRHGNHPCRAQGQDQGRQQGRQDPGGWRSRQPEGEVRPSAAASAPIAKSGSSEPPFLWPLPRQAFGAARLADVAHRDLGRPFLVELEQLGRLEQLGERRVAVVARIERRLVADLLADRADARPAALARRRLDGVAQQRRRSLASRLSLARRHAQRRAGAVVARQLAGVDVDRGAGRDRQLVEVEEARARVDERLGRLLARRSRRPRRPWRAGTSRAA